MHIRLIMNSFYTHTIEKRLLHTHYLKEIITHTHYYTHIMTHILVFIIIHTLLERDHIMRNDFSTLSTIIHLTAKHR